jgi:hypothetical protein
MKESDAEQGDELVARGQADVLSSFLAALEHKDCGHTADAVLDRNLLIRVDVELADLHFAFEFIGNFIDDGCERFARTAPGGSEVHENGYVGLQYLGFEILISELKDVLACHGASLSAGYAATLPLPTLPFGLGQRNVTSRSTFDKVGHVIWENDPQT